MKLFFTRVRWKVVLHKNWFWIKLTNLSSIKLNKTKEETATNKGDSQNGYSLEYQRRV